MSVQALHFAAPTIEVVSESPRLEMLQVRLKQAGLRPIRAPREIDPALANPILIDATIVSSRDRHLIVSACQRHGNRPVVLIGSERGGDKDTIHLKSADQISGLPSRLRLRQRKLTKDRETELRAETTQLLTKGGEFQNPSDPPHVVYCGPQTSDFNALKSQLADEGIILSAALTEHTLRSVCGTGQITSVLFDLTAASNSTHRMFKTFVRSAERASVSLLVANADNDATDYADHIFEAPLSETETISTLSNLIHARTKHRETQRPRDPSIRDSATGLYSRSFLETHLASQLKAADQSGQPLTLIGIELKNHLRGAKPTADSLLKHLRVTDLAARYSARHIVVSLPATAYSGAIQMARRLQAECEMIADVTALERRQFHTAQSLLLGLFARPDLAASRRG